MEGTFWVARKLKKKNMKDCMKILIARKQKGSNRISINCNFYTRHIS